MFVNAGGLTPVCCLKTTLATSGRLNTVRSPPARAGSRPAAGTPALMSSRIRSMTDVIVCVVNTLAVTTCPGGHPDCVRDGQRFVESRRVPRRHRR